MARSISYSGVILDDESRALLLSKLKVPDGDGWKVVIHHLTIGMGPLPDKTLLDKEIVITVTGVDRNEKVMAVRCISPIPVKSGKPHITIAVNKLMGGKPVDSQELNDWIDIPAFQVKGIVREVDR